MWETNSTVTNPMSWQGATGDGYSTCEEMAWVVKTSEVGEDSKEDTAVALEAYLKRQVSNGHFRQLPFQLLYILCLLACLQDVHAHVKTYSFKKLMQRIHFIFILPAYRDIIWKTQIFPCLSFTGTSCIDFSKVTPDLHLCKNKSNVFKEILCTAGTV